MPLRLPSGRLFTLLHGLAHNVDRAARVSPRPGRRGGALLSVQQPHPQHLVSAERAGARQQRLFGRPICRPRLLQPGAVLDCRRLRLARAVRDRRRDRHHVWRGVVRVSTASRTRASGSTRPSSTTSRPAAALAPPAVSTFRSRGRHRQAAPSKRQILGASIGQFCGNSTLVFFLTWFPTYLATERHMDWIKSGFYAVMPYIAASVGVLVGGFVSDMLHPPDRLRQSRPQAADRRRPAARLDHRRGELRRRATSW